MTSHQPFHYHANRSMEMVFLHNSYVLTSPSSESSWTSEKQETWMKLWSDLMIQVFYVPSEGDVTALFEQIYAKVHPASVSSAKNSAASSPALPVAHPPPCLCVGLQPVTGSPGLIYVRMADKSPKQMTAEEKMVFYSIQSPH
jgi:hypothetical protein